MDLTSFEIVNDSITESITRAFGLPVPDTYLYAQESSSVTLAQASEALSSSGGGYKYHYYHGSDTVTVKQSDVAAYTDIFASGTDTEKLTTSFVMNAKKASPRDFSARYLQSRRLVPPSFKATKLKTHLNPYLDLWALCCRQLGFLGPLNISSYEDPRAAKQSHPILPIFMHHFGCAIPSLEALQLIKYVARDGSVLDVGCGNAYWTWLLRRQHVRVVPIDDCSSTWRTIFADDIIKSDAIKFLNGRDTKHEILLLVYPITGANHLTKRIIDVFQGDTIVYVGTQNANRYTGFQDVIVDEYFQSSMPGWHKVVHVPIPSFPGKDDALFIFQKKKHIH